MHSHDHHVNISIIMVGVWSGNGDNGWSVYVLLSWL